MFCDGFLIEVVCEVVCVNGLVGVELFEMIVGFVLKLLVIFEIVYGVLCYWLLMIMWVYV